uniref:Groucho/TLE N-terminal Q-rich domain-containing protein n=1 Tax=Periophthalmus magnuspinnatus TaxID=409849 RepID=A0A3B4ASH1_9GOBI
VILTLSQIDRETYTAAASGTPQSLKLTYPETLDRIKEEFQFLQTQYHSLKLECEKLATEKTEIQRHYVMYYEMSYGLNIEMHKQTEIAKRLNVICAQLIPFLSQEHQQQVVQAMERAKQVTMGELNASIGQQLQAQHLSQHAGGLPVGPHPSGLPHPGLALGGSSGLLALSGALGAQLAAKDERAHLEAAAAAAAAADSSCCRGLWPLPCGMLEDFVFSVLLSCVIAQHIPACTSSECVEAPLSSFTLNL